MDDVRRNLAAAQPGRIRIAGPNPADPVIIEANMLADGNDMRAATASVQLCREIGNSAPLRPFTAREVMPGRFRRIPFNVLGSCERAGGNVLSAVARIKETVACLGCWNRVGVVPAADAVPSCPVSLSVAVARWQKSRGTKRVSGRGAARRNGTLHYGRLLPHSRPPARRP